MGAIDWSKAEDYLKIMADKLKAIDAKADSPEQKKADKANLLLELLATGVGADAIKAVEGILTDSVKVDVKRRVNEAVKGKVEEIYSC